MSVLDNLFNDGEYYHILVNIFNYLDGASLEACHLVSKQWRAFLWTYTTSAKVRERLKQSLRTGVATTRRVKLSEKISSFKCDNTSLLVGLDSGHMELWERSGRNGVEFKGGQSTSSVEWGSPRKRLGEMGGHIDVVKSVDMSPKWLVSGSWDNGIRLFERESGSCIAQSDHLHNGPISKVILSEERSWILSSSRDFRVKKLDIISCEEGDGVKLVEDPTFELNHKSSIADMCFDQNRILTGGNDARALLWPFPDQKTVENQSDLSLKPIRSLVGHGNALKCVSLKGDVALTGSKDRTCKVWRVSSGTCLRSLPHSSELNCVTMNSVVLVTGDEFSDVFVWDLEACIDPDVEEGSSKLLLRTLTGHNGTVHSLQFTPTGLVTADVTGLIIVRDFWNCVQEGPGLRILRCPEGVNCMVVDDNSIAVGLLNKVANLYNRQTLQLVHSMTGHTDHIWSIDMNKKYIVTGSWDATVTLWDRKQGTKEYYFRHPHEREISSVKIRGNRVYISSISGAIAVLRETAGDAGSPLDKFELEVMLPSQPELGEIYSMDVDDKHILTGHTYASTSLQIWNKETVQPIKVIHENTSESIVWNLHLAFPLALVCRDNEVLDIYDLESNSCLKSLRHQSKVLNASLFRGVIIVGCQYGLLAFWDMHEALNSSEGCEVIDINHPSCLRVLTEHSGAISNIAVDSQELITDDYDGVVILRKIRSHSQLKRIFNKQQ